MTTIRQWTGREANALRGAYRLSIRGFAEHLGLGFRTVANWQARGADIVLRPALQSVLDTALERASDEVKARFEALLAGDPAELGRQSGTVTNVDRQQFLRLTGAAGALSWLELLTPAASAAPASVPAKVGQIEIDQIRDAAVVFRSWYNAHGGGLAREAVFTQLRRSAQLLHADCPQRLRPELFTAVAHLADVAALMAGDAHEHDDARRAAGFGVACAEEAGDWHWRAWILSRMAFQALWRGDPDAGLTHVELALVRGERLTFTERASLHATRANVLAQVGRAQDALAAVGAADDAFAHSDPTVDPPPIARQSPAAHQRDTGTALFELSLAGRSTEAAPRLAYAVTHFGPEPTRMRVRTRTQIKLASLHMATGDPREASVIGAEALDAAADLRSRVAVEELRDLHRFAGRHPHVTEATELRDRITETLAA